MSKPDRTMRTDGELTRTRILKAAGHLFAEEGYAETTNKAIAALAEVDLASLNYHFGSRSGLYQSVLKEAHQHIIPLIDLQKLADSKIPPQEKLAKLIDGIVESSSARTDWHVIVLTRELMSPTSHFEILFKEEALPKLSVVYKILSEITGIPEDNPILIRCLINIAAPCLMLLVLGRNAPEPFREFIGKPHQAMAQHLYSFTSAGLKQISREYKKENHHQISKK